MKRLFKTYIPFTKGVIQEFVIYRFNFYLYMLGSGLQTIVLIYIWAAVFSSSTKPVINGFTLDEMITYIVMSTLTGLLISNDVHWSIGNDVRTGDIAMNLIKPVSYHLKQYFAAMGNVIGNFIFLVAPIWSIYSIYRFIVIGEIPSIIRILLYLVSALLSSLLLFFINFMFGLAAFYVEYIFGFIFAKEALFRLISGELIPLSFFPKSVLAIFQFLPFAGLIYTPVMIYLGKYQGTALLLHFGIQVVWVIGLYVFCHVLWKKAIKRLRILGG